MSVTALLLFLLYLAVGFVLKTLVQRRRTGDSGFRGVSGQPGSPEWWAGVSFAAALVAGLFGPVAALLGLEPVTVLTIWPVQVAGVVVATAGIVATVLSQVAMGTNWRIGVDAAERTQLVTSGVFSVVRNPFFTATAVTGLGLALVVPNVIAVAGLVLLLVAIELQVRVVEEPYLLAAHGAEYAQYAGRVGRFLPGIGRIHAVGAAA